jgi:hypothetical protein
MQGTWGKISQETLVRPCTAICVSSYKGKVNIVQNKQVQTDTTVLNNEPDIMIRDNERGICMLINVGIAEDRNVIKQKAEKIATYTDLSNRNSAHVE